MRDIVQLGTGAGRLIKSSAPWRLAVSPYLAEGDPDYTSSVLAKVVDQRAPLILQFFEPQNGTTPGSTYTAVVAQHQSAVDARAGAQSLPRGRQMDVYQRIYAIAGVS